MIHVIGFPHTRFSEVEFSHCAYSTKVVRWVEMMGELGEEITVYWGGNEPINTAGVSNFVSTMSDAEQHRHFGPDLPASILHLDWNPDTPHWRQLNHRVAAELYTRWNEGDLVAVLSGSNHDGLIHEWQRATFIEPWVGYSGISSLTKAKAFESSAWRHTMYGQYRIEDGNPLDAVVPNYYRPEDFTCGKDGGYLLYIGRITLRKGIADAAEIARRMNLPLIFAGQGGRLVGGNTLIYDGETTLELRGLDFEYLGVVGPERRRELYAGASCSLVPTIYIEPFGGVFAEALLSGVMPVCRDWGAFVEYVPEKARFSTIDQACEAVEWAVSQRGLESYRGEAIHHFGTHEVAKQFAEWLGRIRGAR